MKRKTSEIIARMCNIAILAALGTVLMLFATFPYPLAPFLDVEFSDTVILVAYALYGFWGALAVAVIKTAFSFIFKLVGYFGIGQIAAFIASLAYILGIFLTSHVFKWFKKGLGWRILSYVVIILIQTVAMVLTNLLFVTPTFVTGRWATCFDSEAVQTAMSYFSSYGTAYIWAVIAVYGPFNLLKGLIVTLAYELVFNRLIFVIFKDNAFIQRYFIGPLKPKEKKPPEKNNGAGADQAYLESLSQPDSSAEEEKNRTNKNLPPK
jgi:riboflavin transporter FmnP